MLISNILLFNLFLIFFFYRIGDFLGLFKVNIFKSIIFGYSIFSILTYYFYFIFKIDVNKILLIWLIIFFISLFFFFKNHIELKKNLSPNKLIIFLIFLITIFYILPAYIYGEQFYVFRGNHWDLFSYLSLGSLFNNYNFSNLGSLFNDFDFTFLTENEKFPTEYKHFNQINQLIFSRPLTSLLIGIYIDIFDEDIFLISYLFKISLILLSVISFRNLIENIKIPELDKILITILFAFSFWLIFIFETDAISHLASIPIFFVIISDICKFEKFENFNTKYLFYFGVLNCGLFLIYPELFCISLVICGIYLLEKFFKSEKKQNFFRSILFVLLIFFFITIPSFKTNYIFLLTQWDLSFSSKKDWWGYFGSFILGKENLVQNHNYVLQLKDYFLNNDLFSTLKYIINSHFEIGYHFFYLNIIPSFFGLYFISIGKITSIYDWINLLFVISVSIYLLNIIIRNTLVLKSNNWIFFSFLFLSVYGFFILIKGNLYTLIKLYTFLSPFIFMLITINFSKKNKNRILGLNYPIIFLLILFPIYKYTSLNHGIGKLDSFPSIMHPKMKTMFKWKLEDKDLNKCSYIDVDIDDYFKKSYLLLKFLNKQINSNLINNKDINLDNKCYLIEENSKFKILFNF